MKHLLRVLGLCLALVIAGSASAREASLGYVGGYATVASANFTRPADTTAYASGDLVANNTSAGSVTPMQFSAARDATGTGMARRINLCKTTTSVTNSSFRLHLYTSSPTAANGDNGAWSTTTSGYLGSLDVTIDKAFSDGACGTGVPNAGSEITFSISSGQVLYGLLEARAAYTPGSAEVFTAKLEIVQN